MSLAISVVLTAAASQGKTSSPMREFRFPS